MRFNISEGTRRDPVQQLKRGRVLQNRLRQVTLDPRRHHQLLQVLPAGNALDDDGPAAVLEVDEVALHAGQRHLRLRGGRTDYRVERLFYFVQTPEGDAEGFTVLVVGDGALDAVEEDAYRGGFVLSEGFRVVVPAICLREIEDPSRGCFYEGGSDINETFVVD